MGVVQGKIVAIPRKASAVFLYERLEYFMRQLKTFFHADGNGMTQEDLENEAYKVNTIPAWMTIMLSRCNKFRYLLAKS